MARGKMVLEHLRNPSDMLMVIEQACRWGMSPFAVARCTAIVRRRISYEGKLVSAAINASGVLQERLDYEFSGEGAARAVTARGTMRGEDKPREVVVTLASARTDNEHWKKSPDQMLTDTTRRVAGPAATLPRSCLASTVPRSSTTRGSPATASPAPPSEHTAPEPAAAPSKSRAAQTTRQTHRDPMARRPGPGTGGGRGHRRCGR